MSWLSKFLNRVSHGRYGSDPRENAMSFPVDARGAYRLSGRANRDNFQDARLHNANTNSAYLRAGDFNQRTGNYEGGGVVHETSAGSYTDQQHDKYNRDVRSGSRGYSAKSYDKHFKEKRRRRDEEDEERPRPIGRDKAIGMVKNSGLNGMVKGDYFAGMTEEEAQASLKQIQDHYMEQATANSSIVYNADTINGVRNRVQDFKVKVNDLVGDPFKSPETVGIETKALSMNTAKEIAKMYDNPAQFSSDYMNNPEFRVEMDSVFKNGVSKDDILAQIKETPKVNVASLPEYLTANKSETEIKALEKAIPNDNPSIQEAMKLSGMPKEYANIYFGTPEMLGVLQEEAFIAEEKIKNLEKAENSAEKNERDKAELLKDKYELEYKLQKSKTEQNRLTAKNYLTGMLAKLGALKTTGKAPEAIANLDAKYKMQLQNMEIQFKLQKTNVDISLQDKLSSIEEKYNKQEVKIEMDLANDKEKVLKEILRLKAKQSKEFAKTKRSYSSRYKKISDKYSSSHKAGARKYLEDLYKNVTEFDPIKISKELGVPYKDGMTFEQYLNAIQERDQMTYTPPMRDKFLEQYKSAYKKGAVPSDEAQMIIDGDLSWGRAKKKTISELRALGYKKSDFSSKKDDDDLSDWGFED